MSIDEIRTRVKKMIGKVSGLNAEHVTDNASFDALDLDSLSRIEILVEIEREFRLELPEELEDENLVSEIKSVEHAVQFVQRLLAAAAVA